MTFGKTTPGPDPPTVQQAEDTTVYRIRLPRHTAPIRTIIQPIPRPGSKQYTCIRYDEHGQYFVDEFTERSTMHNIAKTDRRHMTHVNCPKYSFNVALSVCQRYCSFPCSVHLEVIKNRGWYNDGAAPPMSEQEGGSETRGKAGRPRKNKEESK